MDKKAIIKGLDTITEGIALIKSALVDSNDSGEVTSAPVTTKEAVSETLPALYDIDDLKAMKYNEFKKFAATLGVKCTGTRAEIMERVLEALDKEGDSAVAPVNEEPEEKPQKKSRKKKKADSDTELSGGDTEDVPQADTDTTDEFDEQAREIADDTPVEAIITALKEVGIKATKKTAVKKLAEALREGLIEVDDDDEEEDVEDVDDVAESDEEEISANSYFAEYDPDGLNNPDEMSEDRAEAIAEKVDEILTAYSEGELSDDDISDYVEDNATEDEVDLLGEEYDEMDVLKLYIELIKRTIDNDGVEHEPSDLYEVGEEDLCCGHILKYVKKSKKYVCEICGIEYEAE